MTTEAEVVTALFDRYSPLGKMRGFANWDGRGYRNIPVVQQFVCASHVRSDVSWSSKRTADFVVYDTCNTANKGLAFYGYEIKCSRSDWLVELKKPEKSQEFIQHCDYWYLVVANKDIVKDGELPVNWGLMIFKDGMITTKKKAKRLTPLPQHGAYPNYGLVLSSVHRGLLTSFLRRVQEQAYDKGLTDQRELSGEVREND